MRKRQRTQHEEIISDSSSEGFRQRCLKVGQASDSQQEAPLQLNNQLFMTEIENIKNKLQGVQKDTRIAEDQLDKLLQKKQSYLSDQAHYSKLHHLDPDQLTYILKLENVTKKIEKFDVRLNDKQEQWEALADKKNIMIARIRKLEEIIDQNQDKKFRELIRRAQFKRKQFDNDIKEQEFKDQVKGEKSLKRKSLKLPKIKLNEKPSSKGQIRNK